MSNVSETSDMLSFDCYHGPDVQGQGQGLTSLGICKSRLAATSHSRSRGNVDAIILQVDWCRNRENFSFMTKMKSTASDGG